MKIRNFLLVLLTVILLASVTTIAYAQTGGGTGSGSGSGGTGPSGGSTGGAWWDLGSKALNNTKSYRIDLVYKKQNESGRKTLRTIVVNCGNGYGPSVRNAVNNYAANNASDGQVRTSGKWAEVACAIKNNSISQLSASGYFSQGNDAVIKELLNDMGVPKKELTQPQDTKPGRIDSYGYRFIIQQITLWGNGGARAAVPRKEAAAHGISGQSVGDHYFGGNTGSLAATGNYQEDIFTEQDDIGITNARSNRRIYSKSNFANNNNGTGYNIIWFYNPYSNRDYSIDAACENCDENNTNGSYFIQDTTDWEAILDSPNVSGTNKNAKTYFTKKIGGCEVLCREEYRIIYPNANDKISVESGRFFTVNKLGGAIYTNGVPNFKQIKITKVRECRVKSGDQRSCLTSFASTAKTKSTKEDKTGSAAGDVGTIKLTYKENYKDSKYNEDKYKNIELKENKYRTVVKDEYINSTVETSNVMLRSTVTKYFELPENTFRWVNIRDGVSAFTKPTEGLEHYLDLETSNLPVSINNKTKDKGESAGTVTLKYDLPKEDPYSLMYKAFNAKNDYFLDSEAKPSDNLYSQAKKGELDDNGKKQIQESACAKLFGFGTTKYNSCVNARTSNKAGNCYNQIAQDNKYVCDIGLCPEEGCLSCRIEGNTYYGKDGKEVSESDYAKQCGCRIVSGKYYGPRGNEITKEQYLVECPQTCRIENGKYYGKKGQIVSKAQYESECPDKCMLCNGGKCCPDLDMVCPDMNGECPGKGRIIIYRPIDLQNPFPGQTNYDRATGNNWCAYNVKTGKMNCKSTNGVATTHIQNNRSTDDENVYNLTPLYEVNLDPTIMKSIRKYNKTNKYDDFNLNCNTKLKEANSANSSDTVCYSKFLREGKTGLKVTGACAQLGNLATCAESRG